VKGLLDKKEPADISDENQELYDELSNRYGADAVDAFLEIYDEDDLNSFEDAYQGGYESEADFAEQFTTGYGLDIPSFVIVDWEATWYQGLRYDYDFQDGFVFSSNW
jgi:hypothetical protein